jgi:hypothetical protein
MEIFAHKSLSGGKHNTKTLYIEIRSIASALICKSPSATIAADFTDAVPSSKIGCLGLS